VQELTDILQTATARIEPMYFRLNVDGGDPIYRERVYCYELYHQMRLQWLNGCPYYLNGEIDKAAHPILTELGAAYAKPDLLIHRPGYMSGNHAIIEVKNSRTRARGIVKDLKTLGLFRSEVRYERAIYLVYGDECESIADRILNVVQKLGRTPPIELWLHVGAGEPAQQVATTGA
jgi:hypothetical protein